MVVSSIWKQIAPWLYEDANKKKITPIPWATFVDESQAMFGSGVAPTTVPKIQTPTAPVVSSINSNPDKSVWITKSTWVTQTQTVPLTTPANLTPEQQNEYDMIGTPKRKITQPTVPTQPTTPELWAPKQDEWIGQSRSEEQLMQDNINKTQEEVNNLKNRQDALWQAEYLKKTKELQEYQAKQKEITDKQKAMSEEQAQIQSSRKLQDAQKSLSQLKRNTAYLSSQWLWQSAWALDAFSQQISNADQVFKEMQQYEKYAEDMRKMGYEFDANAYEQGMKEQQDELDKYVSDTIQTIFNNMSAAEMAGQMDTVDEVDAFAEKYFNSIDTDIANMTRKQIAIAENKLLWMQDTLKSVREVVAKKAEAEATKRVVDTPLSKELWYLVNGMWEPIMDFMTGAKIVLPPDAPMEPIYNKETGQLVTFTSWPNGELIPKVQRVTDAQQKPMDWQVDPYGNVFAINENWQKVFPWQQQNNQQPQGGIPDPMWDLRWNSDKFPWQAWAKNNNPAGIKTTISEATKKLLSDAWIQWANGTPPPQWETGVYMNFNTMADGLAAQKILLSQAGSNDIAQRLQAWVWRGKWPTYVADIMNDAGIPSWSQFTDLSENELDNLLMSQIKFENKGLYDVLTGNTWSGIKTQWGVDLNQALAVALEKCSSWAQCGKFVNDILEASWAPRLIGNEYETKVKAIQTIWEATTMEDVGAGSIFAYPIKWSPYWHIGIVTAVNQDWTINIIDYNYKNDEQKRERLNVNPWEILGLWGVLSRPIIREDTVQIEAPQQQQSQYTQQQKNVLDKLVGKSITSQDRLSLWAVWLTDIDIANYESSSNRPLTKDEKKDLLSIQDDLKTDPRRKEYLTLQSKIKTLDWIKSRLNTWKATAQDKQQLISDFAKVLDPTSVVREWEYALAAKYWQSKVNKTIQDISNWYSTNWPISDDSAKVLAEAVWLRFESTQSSNDEAVQEQLKRAEIFLWRPVKPEELWVTINKQQTNNTIQQTTNSWVKVTPKAQSILDKYL